MARNTFLHHRETVLYGVLVSGVLADWLPGMFLTLRNILFYRWLVLRLRLKAKHLITMAMVMAFAAAFLYFVLSVIALLIGLQGGSCGCSG